MKRVHIIWMKNFLRLKIASGDISSSRCKLTFLSMPISGHLSCSLREFDKS